ncbi:acetyl-CoA synthetase [Actinopolymorpha cephalotaxi]|uniref:acetate--CoA ligase n=1 Tax=Actinopolymorpha cephalotaxi TaxID=504797 RepID=A0A1I2XQ23_9ACTN|nr:acetate--CoA ligase [Actinopolymorpha cephalotaxi]NYH87129.1 acetyl-CoA synthetase [Actinopolymorpha cephalotaxi]SFH15608.1 acetyl-CoA synthetase [Actinopolymorpha cephalotaxi]
MTSKAERAAGTVRVPTVPPVPAPRSRADDYDRLRRGFSWQVARDRMSGLPGGRGLNIAYEAVDLHAEGPLAGKVAMRCRDLHGNVTDHTYADLATGSNRFANLLCRVGVGRGDRVFSLLGRVPELYVAALGTWKNTSVFAPLFSAFGPEPVRERMRIGEARVLVTTPRLYERKVAPVVGEMPHLEYVLLVGAAVDTSGSGAGDAGAGGPGRIDLRTALLDEPDDFEIPPTDPEDVALLHFTSGTTGRPKGAVHVHEAVVAHHATAVFALDLHENDVYWCTADPGWVTGTSYGIVAPLTHGVTMVVDEAEFDLRGWYSLLENERVTVWYTAPTALRMLMRYGAERARAHDLSALRFVASVGEPLNPEVVRWGEEAFGQPVHDNWWQTETGAIMIGNFANLAVRPGSMGRPIPGVNATLLVRGEDGRARVVDGEVGEVTEIDVVGEIALRPGWPSMFRGYVHDDARYAACFAGGWYLSGDLARRDADGYYWFVGRADDVIKSAGHLVGPFEVESVLLGHPAVAEVGVIGRPDPVAGEIVKAFVTPRPGVQVDDDLRLDLLAYGRRKLGAVAPREVEFAASLPHTRSGKVMRRLLRARELGLPEGDTSTLERL